MTYGIPPSVDPMGEAMEKLLREGYEQLIRAEPTEGTERGPLGLPMAPADPLPSITVRRAAYWLPLSLDVAVARGAMTEDEARAQGWTPYVPVKVSRWRRTRRRWAAWRERAGRRVGGWIAGVDLAERDEDW